MLHTVLDAGSAAVLSNKLLQLGNGAVYNVAENGKREVIEIHGNKVEAFLELVEELNGKPVHPHYPGLLWDAPIGNMRVGCGRRGWRCSPYKQGPGLE